MFILRALIVGILLIFVAFVALSYWNGSAIWPNRHPASPSTAVGTTGIDTEKARARGAELGEKAATAANKAQETLKEAAITTKIKAKMTLDDSVKARSIDVSTTGGVVTLGGTVESVAERNRAVALARETDGVTRVVDRLTVQPAARF